MSVIDRPYNGSIIPQEIQSNNDIQVYILGKAHWVAAHEITYLEGDGNYTYINTRRGKRYLVSKNMKTIQEMLRQVF